VPHYQHSTGRRPNRSGTGLGRAPSPVVSQRAPWRVGHPIRCVGPIRGDERPGGNRCCPVATDAAPDAICMAFRSHCVALETGELSGMSNVADMGVSASKRSQ